MLCCEHSLLSRDINEPIGTVLRCNMWDCDYCRPRKSRALQRLAKAGEPNTFITLTSSEETNVDADQAAATLVKAWRLTVKRIKRKYKIKSLPYIAVVEATKAGRPHLHILARSIWIHQGYLSDCLRELARAPIVWIERIQPGRSLAAYISKYVGKDPHHFQGCKRFWRSLDWIVQKAKWIEENSHPRGAWKVCNYSVAALARRVAALGYVVAWDTDKAFRCLISGDGIDLREAESFFK